MNSPVGLTIVLTDVFYFYLLSVLITSWLKICHAKNCCTYVTQNCHIQMFLHLPFLPMSAFEFITYGNRRKQSKCSIEF